MTSLPEGHCGANHERESGAMVSSAPREQQTTPTDPRSFANPYSRANRLGRLAWALVWLALFRPSPPPLHGWRRFLLRLFGARLAGNVQIHPSVRVWAPWRLRMGRDSTLDRDIVVHNAADIAIGERVSVSFGALLCSVSHDHTKRDYPIVLKPIAIGDDCWLAAQCYVGPGADIAAGCVVAARAVVTRPTEPWGVVAGNPARRVKSREIETRA
jgi:putative colanic acid biosynthesis acetyltransferase WcaF